MAARPKYDGPDLFSSAVSSSRVVENERQLQNSTHPSDVTTQRTVYLLDGSGYIFRAFYAVQPLSTKAGFPTNALFGFTRMLEKLLRDTKPQFLAVMFDTSAPTFRHELYHEYKANRAECPPELVPQMPYFRRIVRALGLPCFEQDGVEADDIIATLCAKLRAAGNRVVIVSGDKDLTQLVEDGVEVWDAMRDIVYDSTMVREKFGVTPQQMRDYLALTGDSSDNVPGVKGIGPKTAEILLRFFGSLDQLLARLPEIEQIPDLRGAKSVHAKIAASVEQLSLSRELVSLRAQVPEFAALHAEDLQWKGANGESLTSLFSELEFYSMLEALKSSLPGAGNIAKDQPCSRNYQLVNQGNWPEFLAELAAQSIFAIDSETSSLDPRTCQLLGLSFSWQDGEAWYLPLHSEIEPENCLAREVVFAALGPILANPQVKKVGANLKYDYEVLTQQGLELEGIYFDTMLASYVLKPDVREHGLKALALKFLRERMQSYEEALGESEHLGQVPLSAVCSYAAHDADASWRLYSVLDRAIGLGTGENEPSLRRVFDQIEMPLVSVLGRMENNGIAVDLSVLQGLEREFTREAAFCQEEVFRLAGEEFNLNSPKQLAEVLFEKLQIPLQGVKKTKTGYSTDAEVLQRLSLDYPIAERILEYRELHKLNSTYVLALQRLVNPKTGRIHASFNQAVAATGRLSSSEPNMQNIPIRNERGRRIRRAFVAAPGCVFICADYSQIELRVLAELSGDENLRRAFIEKEDIHQRTAREIFGAIPPSPDEEKKLRRIAKTINFGIIYGISAFRLAGQIGVSRSQAQQYMNDYFARYPKVRVYFETLRRQSAERGYVETLFGRRRMVEDLDTEGRDQGYASRSMINAPLQGTAAEIIKLAMIRLDQVFRAMGREFKLVLQVHDELIFEVPEEKAEEVSHLVDQVMSSAVDLSVPLVVDIAVGRDWGSS